MIKRMAVASLTVLLMASLAVAQPPGQGQGRGQGRGQGGPGGRFGFGGGGFQMGYLQIAGNEAVQTELKATEDQKTSIGKLAEEQRQAFFQQFQGRGPGQGQGQQNLTDEEREARREQFRKDMEEREKKSREALAGILDDGQMKRLRQIWVQVQGNRALSNDEIAGELKISDLQKEEINDTREEAQREIFEQVRDLFPPGQSDEERDAARAKFRELQKQADEKVIANLTDEQKTQFTAMKGAAFEMPPGGLLGGRFGQGGGRFGQGGGRPGGDGAGGNGGNRRRPGGDGGNGGGNRPRRPDSV